jgi:hypothetical protein
MKESSLNKALRQFEATEANISKLEQLWKEMIELIPSGISFGDNPTYEDKYRNFKSILEHLPKIDGWKPEMYIMELNEIAQGRLDAYDIGEPEAIISIEEMINQPGKLLREYRYQFNRKRKELIRDEISNLINKIDQNLILIVNDIGGDLQVNQQVDSVHLDNIKTLIAEIDTLLGSSVSRPPRWNDLKRHLRFRQRHDVNDIIDHDWPIIRDALQNVMYSTEDAIPIEIDDLSNLVSEKPSGEVATKLCWEKLNAEEFERLVFTLISFEDGYENPKWLTKTHASDRGRDLSVYRTFTDPLGGVIRQRVIIQCKHWLDRSISTGDVSDLRGQMRLWEPPRLDILIIVTTGRFTTDVISYIEKHNQSDTALTIEMWPESHLESLLASRPGIIAEFRLR